MTTIANVAAALKRRARRAASLRASAQHARKRALSVYARKRAMPALLLLTDADRLADPSAALADLPRGSGVVLRDYDIATDRARRLALGLRLRRACTARGLRLIVAGDARLALAIGADGLHLPEWMLARAGNAVRLVRAKRGAIVTAACHGWAALVRARRAGCDAALLAPVFATASHPGRAPLGALRFARLARTAGLPVFALGGIDAARARRLAGSGAAGIAGIGFALARRS